MAGVNRTRAIAGGVLIALVVACGIGYVGWRAASNADGGTGGGLDLSRAGTLLYVDPAGGRVRQVTRDDTAHPVGTGPACARVYAAAGTLACLRAGKVPMSAEIDLYAGGDLGTPRKTLPLWGDPSRVRVSSDGRLVAWTVFRTGDSYLVQGNFATTAGIYDLTTGAHYGSLEDFTTYVDGEPWTAQDRNFWGITFLADDVTFYATMASQGHTWLLKGDLTNRRLTAVRQNVECPSVSPDQTRIAYKYRTGKRWRLHVLDLATGRDTALAETAHIDDQATWLDDRTVAYSKNDGGKPAVFAVPADGSGAPTRVLTGTSPVPL
jgi:hypothetical protein